ncbi:MAG TPA: glycosyltransferase, partial [Candidatus Kapabacteria bacterium]|nr:glycosyltransferase [Candidatus Kapabacteria bacterium]
EAMAMGCPIITTPIGASGIEGVINGMHVMVSENADEFVSTGLRLLSDEKERAWLAKNSRALVERRYRWDHIFSSFDDIIEGIVPDFFKVGTLKREAIQ